MQLAPPWQRDLQSRFRRIACDVLLGEVPKKPSAIVPRFGTAPHFCVFHPALQRLAELERTIAEQSDSDGVDDDEAGGNEEEICPFQKSQVSKD